MPKVTKRKAKKPAAKKTRRAKSTTKAKSRNASKPSLFSSLGGAFKSVTPAIAAGGGIIVLLGVAVFWTGGYVGVLGEKFSRFVGERAVSAGFEVRRITVRGLERTAEEELLTALGPVIGGSIMHLDADAARARIEDLGWVRVAAVSRLLPNTVHVSVRERKPAAVWQLSGKFYLIDGVGAVIDEVDAYQYSNLPLIVGAGRARRSNGDVARLESAASALGHGGCARSRWRSPLERTT